jgi:hypothetical protein
MQEDTDDFNVSGERLPLKNKFDLDQLNISTLEMDTINTEDLKVPSGGHSKERFREILSKSPYCSEKYDSILLPLNKAKSEQPDDMESDPKYCDIVKKYKLERRAK